MKTLFLLPILLLSLLSTSCWSVDSDDLLERDGLYYEKFSDTPFTGKFIEYHEDGYLWMTSSFKNGLQEGESVLYHPNGQVQSKGIYKNGEREGEWIFYHSNGQLVFKGSYKDGKKEGEWFRYNSDGIEIFRKTPLSQ